MTGDAPPQLPPSTSLGYLVNHLARSFARALHHEISPFGVVPGQFAQLLALYEQDDVTQRELCERVRIEQPTMANTLARMERDGLIQRHPDPEDRRQARIVLTEHARSLEPGLTAAARRVNAAAVAGLEPRDVERFVEMLQHLSHNLDEGSR